mmetsp:Transcript_9638/g.19403  ORF Transcript_9638/g.19403 Transcript_9638/m.19403 type:complete len:99 (-) Transcript_9638:4746-5042(-)
MCGPQLICHYKNISISEYLYNFYSTVTDYFVLLLLAFLFFLAALASSAAKSCFAIASAALDLAVSLSFCCCNFPCWIARVMKCFIYLALSFVLSWSSP